MNMCVYNYVVGMERRGDPRATRLAACSNLETLPRRSAAIPKHKSRKSDRPGFQKMQVVVQKKRDQIVLEPCYVSNRGQWAADAAKARHPKYMRSGYEKVRPMSQKVGNQKCSTRLSNQTVPQAPMRGRKIATARHCRRDRACVYPAIRDGWRARRDWPNAPAPAIEHVGPRRDAC